MEWAIGIPLVLLLLICPLMMVGMIVGGWIFGRKAMGNHGGHAGHGMMCMGHGASEHGTGDTGRDPALVNELKSQREQLDRLIARAEEEGLR
jgi:hypothetical protein